MKKALFPVLLIALLFSFNACKKQEEQPEAKAPAKHGPIIDMPATAPGHGNPAQKPQFKVVVPPEVREGWVSVTIVVDDKKENRQEEFVVDIGDEFKIPDSNLTVKVGPFLPDFKMSAEVITSASNEPNNPSVGIAVFEDSNKLFPASGEYGWLYAKFPTIHSFQHERYALTLKAGTKRAE